jgi:uncharacterized protein YhjY with autotransporter beta-barrel domain
MAILCVAGSQNAWSILLVDDRYVIPQDISGYPINPLSNDIVDTDNLQPISNANFTLQFGQGTIDTSQGIVVIPGPGFVGQLVFTYTVTDITGTDIGRIVVDVQPNAAPHQAVADFHHVLQNDFPIGFNVLSNDNFSVSNGVQIVATSASAQGGAINIDASGQFLSYQPPASYTGLDTFTYDLQDQATSVISQALVTVYVGVNPGINPPLVGSTTEEQDAIDIIDQICNDTPNGPLPCTLIATLSDAQRQSLAQQVGGRHAKAQSRAIRQIKNRQSTNVRSRLSEVRGQRNRVSVNNLNTVVYNEDVPLGRAFQPMINSKLGGGSAGEDDIATPWGFFINGNLSFGEGSGDNDRPQYDQDGFNITSGADYRLSERLVVGGALGYSESNLDFSFNRGTQNSDSYTFSIFGNYYPTTNFYIDFLTMWVNADIDIDRRINVATFSQSLTSNTSSQQLVAASSFGYEFAIKSWQGSIYTRAEFSDLSIDAYTESGNGSFELAVSEQQSDTLDFAFGGRLAYVFPLRRGIFIPSLEFETVTQGDEEYAIESRFAQVPTGQNIQVDGQEQDDQYYNASLSLSAVWSGGRSGYFRYESLLGHDEYKSDAYSLGFRFEF